MISEREWTSIRSMITTLVHQIAGQRGNLITGEVIKHNTSNKTVWLKELGDQPIPVVGHSYEVKYYDTDNNGVVQVKKVTVDPTTPDIGDFVLVAMEMGSQSLPRCVGVIHGRNWIIPEDEG